MDKGKGRQEGHGSELLKSQWWLYSLSLLPA